MTLASSLVAASPECSSAQPSERALALKNAALELRDAESWGKAAGGFRDAADELSGCEGLDDERLRWSLWAIEAFERNPGPPEDRQAMQEFVERQLKILESHPASHSMTDLPRLREARGRLQPVKTTTSPADAEPSLDPRRTSRSPRSRAGMTLVGVGSAVFIPSLVLMGAFSAKNFALNSDLRGADGVYVHMKNTHCGITPMEDLSGSNPANCDALRSERERIKDDGHSNNRILTASIVTSIVGGAAALAGLVLLIRNRKQVQQSRLRIAPMFGGLQLGGHF